MEVLAKNNFPFKPNERDYSSHFATITKHYKKAVKYAEKTLNSEGFLTHQSIGIVGEKNNPVVIANLLARNILNDEEIVCMFSFPSRQQTSTKKTIIRIKKLNGYWKKISLFLCFTKGAGKFSLMSRRIYRESIKVVKNEIVFVPLKIYSLNLNNGEIRELWRNNTK